jgi:DNA modification methylase
VITGDCREVMGELSDGSVDVVVTDPPYPNLKGGLMTPPKCSGGVARRKENTVAVGDNWSCSLDWCADAWRVARYGVLVFCGYNSVCAMRDAFPAAKTMCLLTWYKRNSSPFTPATPRYNTEFIWGLSKEPGLAWNAYKTTMFDIPGLPAGCFASERVLADGTGKSAHPAQKPIELMRALLAITKPDMSILDPFVGTGTTGIAAVQLGRRFLGIELDPGYAEIARKRVAGATRQERLF